MPGWDDRTLNAMREVGDSVADDPVAAVLDHGQVGAVNALLHTLIRNDQLVPAELPPEVHAYLDATDDLPSWADMHRVRRAQEFFGTWGLQISLSLFCASLPSAYAAADGVKVLYLTARLDTDTRRRIMETGQFLIDVMTPGSLEPGGDGRRVIQRVRLMHAAVRHLVAARALAQPGLWDPTWGTPINQEDLAGTLMSFAFVVGDPLPKLGVDVPVEQADDYIHAWRVIGHLLGLREELLPVDLAEASDLVATIRRRQFRSSPEGVDMTAALLAFLAESAPELGRLDVFPAVVRHLIGKDAADLVGVPTGRSKLWRSETKLLWKIVRFVETFVAHDRLLERAVEDIARDTLVGVFDHERGGVRASFSIPDVLADRWLPSVARPLPPAPAAPPQPATPPT